MTYIVQLRQISFVLAMFVVNNLATYKLNVDYYSSLVSISTFSCDLLVTADSGKIICFIMMAQKYQQMQIESLDDEPTLNVGRSCR